MQGCVGFVVVEVEEIGGEDGFDAADVEGKAGSGIEKRNLMLETGPASFQAPLNLAICLRR